MKLRLTICVLALLFSGASFAADETDWNNLSGDQQAVLDRFADDWDSFSDTRRERLIKGAERWTSMTAEQREAAQGRFGDHGSSSI